MAVCREEVQKNDKSQVPNDWGTNLYESCSLSWTLKPPRLIIPRQVRLPKVAKRRHL